VIDYHSFIPPLIKILSGILAGFKKNCPIEIYKDLRGYPCNSIEQLIP